MAKKNEINVVVELTEKDFLYYNFFNSLKMIIGFIVYATVFLLLLSKMGYYGEQSSFVDVVKPLFMFLLFLGFYVGFVYIKSKGTYGKYEMIRAPHKYSISKNTIKVSTATGAADLKMNELYQVIETKKMLMIYSTRGRAHLITVNSFEDKSSYNRLKDMFRESVTKKKLKFKKVKK